MEVSSSEVVDVEKKKGLSEKDVGISEYLGNHSGFFGIIKQRYSDFCVHEVSENGQVVHLTDEEIPSAPTSGISFNPNDDTLEPPPDILLDKLDQLDLLAASLSHGRRLEKLKSCIGKSEIIAKSDDSTETSEVVPLTELSICVDGINKDIRKEIHAAIQVRYQGLFSNFKEMDQHKYIVIKKGGTAGDKRTSDQHRWPKSQKFTTFVLYKENYDTSEAINGLAFKSGLKANLFTYAGTKDKRAKTTQLVSVPQTNPSKLCQSLRGMRPGLRIGNFSFRETPQKLGQLKGNLFNIVLREVEGSKEDIEASVESCLKNGFINYFGMQRFGNSTVATHTIGQALLKSQWEKAIDLILQPPVDVDINDCVDAARQEWHKTRDATAAFGHLYGRFKGSVEGQLLRGLMECDKKDLIGALDRIPRNMRMLYVHAFQSYIWNLVVSKRIEKFGVKVLAGDLIRCRRSDITKPEIIMNDADNEVNDEIPAEKDASNSEGKVRVLKENEIESTNITQVVMPLPGYNIIYPDNEIGNWYTEILSSDDFTIQQFKQRVKDYSMAGTYRNILYCPEQIETEICFYEDFTKPLLASDFDSLNGISIEENKLAEGSHKAVILTLMLPASTYATMALREILKMETSSQFQSSLNKEAKGDIDSQDHRKERQYGRGRGWRVGRGGSRGWGEHRGERGGRGGWQRERGGWQRGRGERGGRGGWGGGGGGFKRSAESFRGSNKRINR